jgi:teichuronic acid biosynthesis glycosyltransferase TuaG
LTDNVHANGELISIVTPAYRAAAYIADTINSVLAQTHQNWEMFIADDCSPDNTREVISGFAAKDSRIKLIACSVNGGPAAARNAALERATGRWVAFLDSDDVWLPQKLEKSLRHAKANDAALTFTGFRRISFDGSQTGSYRSVPEALTYRQLLGNTVIATSTVLIDREKTGEIRMQRAFYDDFVCWLGILRRGLKGSGLDEDLMRYRVVKKSVSRNKSRSAQEVWKTYREIEKLGLVSSAWHFVNYAARGYVKYRGL